MRHYRGSLVRLRYSRPNSFDSLLELYGRCDAFQEVEKRRDSLKSLSWASALAVFSSASYLNPQNVSPEVRSNTLRSFCSVVKEHRDINTRTNDQLWTIALNVFQYPKKERRSLWEDRLYCSFVLYRQKKYFNCVEFSRKELCEDTRERNHHNLSLVWTTKELCFCLNFFSVYFMSAVKCQQMLSKNDIAHFCKTLQIAKDRICHEPNSKEEKEKIIASSQLSIWSLDWVFHEVPIIRNSIPSRKEWAVFFHESISEKIFCIEVDTLKTESLQSLQVSPWMLHRAIADHSQSLYDLEKIFNVAQDKEKHNYLFTIYDLALEAGSLLLQNHLSPANDKLLSFLGTSLSPELIALAGNKHQSYRNAQLLLIKMAGLAAYEALRSVVFHLPASAQRLQQEESGDILTPSHPDGQTWLEALQSLQDSLILPDDSWRSKLPHTLRLVSDAGKCRLFYQLLANYDGTCNPSSSLLVASSLAQIMRRSGTWWQATCVLDLISASPLSHLDEKEEFFLRDACLQTIFSLRTGRKWKEALEFYSSLRSVVPPQGFRWMVSIATDLPSNAPWEKVLQILQQEREIPAKFLTALKCIHGGEALPSDSHGRRHVIRCLVDHGQWERLASISKSATDSTMWGFVFAAARRCRLPVSEKFFSIVSPEAFKEDKNLRLSFAIAKENGIMACFFKIIKSLQISKTSDWYQLVELFVTRVSQKNYRMINAAALKFFVDVVSEKPPRLFFTVEENYLSGKYFIHSFGSVLSSFHLKQLDKKTRTFVAAPPLAVNVTSQLICYYNSDVILASKPYGVDTLSFASGVLRTLECPLCFICPLSVPSNAAGLLVFVSPLLPTKWCWVTLTVLCNALPILAGNTCCSTPILACNFISLYQGTVLSVGRKEPPQPTVVQLILHASILSLSEYFEQVRRDANAEGWDIMTEPEEIHSDEISFLIKQARVEITTKSFEATIIEASLEQTHLNC